MIRAALYPSVATRPPTLARLQMMLLAGAVALAGLAVTTTPARAHDDVVRFLLGAAAIAVIIGAVDDRHRARHVGHRVLPDSCMETARVRGRNIAIYNARCLHRAGYHRLPRHCSVDLRTNRGHRAGYAADCLHQAGYRAERFSHQRPRHDSGRPHRQPHRGAFVLPSHCEMHYRQRGQRVWGYDGRCLSRAGHNRLPSQCLVRDRAGNQYFNGQCMINAGYRRGR
ncbi:MAG: hypothetical protein JJU19_13390 [Pararhodobacter sp.]|nr:hypothetical protein [Pararhodobacter sp.]